MVLRLRLLPRGVSGVSGGEAVLLVHRRLVIGERLPGRLLMRQMLGGGSVLLRGGVLV
ncbi:hypothetical protein GCM10009771_20370 [Nesterenkonia flava]